MAHENLDRLALAPSYRRETYVGDPPPAAPPNDHCLWQRVLMDSHAWVETDDHSRDRITGQDRTKGER